MVKDPLLMRIGLKILSSFIIIIISIAVMGFITITSSQEKIIDEIGNDHTETLAQTMKSIDSSIREKVVGLIVLSDKKFVDDYLTNLKPTSKTSANPNPLELRLQESADILEKKYGYGVYNEIFVFDKSGSIIASVGPEKDKPINKDDWWDSVTTNGYFVGDVNYDSNSKIYTQNFAYRITDSKGNFLGVLQTDIKLQDVLITIYELRSMTKFLDADVSLIDSSGKVIYDSAGTSFHEPIPLTEYVMMSETNDYFLSSDVSGPNQIHVYSKSQSQPDFPSIGWTLVITQSTDKILKPVIGLTNTILIISMTTITSALVVAIYVRSSISTPLRKLKDASVKIAEGNFDVKVNVKTDDEIEELATKFDYMRESIKFTNENLRELIKLRTNDLQNALDEIKKNQSWRDDMTESFSNKVNDPLDSLIKNIEQFKIDQNTETLDLIDSDLMRLRTTTRDFVDYYMTRTQNVKYDMQDVEINDLVNDSIQLFSKHPKSNIIIPDLGKDVKVFVDKEMFRRAIFNIMDNSLKFLTDGLLEIKTRKIGNQAEIEISGNRDVTDLLIEDMFELNSTQHGEDPMGMYVAKSIITEHAGSVEVTKADSKVIITIRLPIFET